MKSKPISHDKKDQLLLTDILRCVVLDTMGSLRLFFVNKKPKYFKPVRDNLVVVCNLTNAIYNVACNGVK